MDALHWLKAHNPYYSNVVLDPSRLADIVEGAEIHGVKELDPAAERLPEDMGPAPDQVALAPMYQRQISRQGECSSPK